MGGCKQRLERRGQGGGGGRGMDQELRYRLPAVGRGWGQVAADEGLGDKTKALWRYWWSFW